MSSAGGRVAVLAVVVIASFFILDSIAHSGHTGHGIVRAAVDIAIGFDSPTPEDGDTVTVSTVTIATTSNTSAIPAEHSVFLDWDNSLVGWWRFDTDTDFTDHSTYTNDGTNDGSTFTTGKRGGARDFDGNYRNITIPDDASLNPTKITVAAWISVRQSKTWNAVLTKDQEGSFAYWLGTGNGPTTGSETPILVLTTGGTSGSHVRFWAAAKIALDEWHHIAATYDGSNVQIYIDGSPSGSPQPYTGGISPGTSPVLIGDSIVWVTYTNSFNGVIDEVMVFNRALNDEEILSIYEAGANQYSNQITGLSDGTYIYRAIAIDSDGDVVETERTVTIDIPGPSVCGDGVREDPEVCDGDDLGGETCITQGFTGGTLACLAGCDGFDIDGCTTGTLPSPTWTDESLENTTAQRMSTKNYDASAVTDQLLSNVLWAAYGAPESRTIQLLDNSTIIYVCSTDGGYKYIPETHSLQLLTTNDCSGITGQYASPIKICLVYDTNKATEARGLAEVGKIGQNIYLEAIALELGTITMAGGADECETALALPTNEKSRIVMALGHPSSNYDFTYAPIPPSSNIPAVIDREVSLELTLSDLDIATEWDDVPLTTQELSNILWAAYGTSYLYDKVNSKSHITVPSAYAIYPFKIYMVNATAVYLYDPSSHSISKHMDGDKRQDIADAVDVSEQFVADAPVILVAASPDPGYEPYYWDYEVGSIGQNVLLESTSLGLGANFVEVTAPASVGSALSLGANTEHMFVMPVGHTAAPPPPTTPENLAAIVISYEQIDLSWDASTDGGVISYRIYRDGSEIASTTTTSYSDTGLSPETTYTYEVSAYNAGGESDLSSPVPATTPAAPQPPSIPQNLAAIVVSHEQINLSWDASTGGVTGYKIYRNDSDITSVLSPDTSYSDTGLSPETTYKYQVSAYNGGGESALSSAVLATTQAAPPGVEICNNLEDNDGDGLIGCADPDCLNNMGPDDYECICTDDDTRACGTGEGICAPGTMLCVAGNWSGDCTGGISPCGEPWDNPLSSCQEDCTNSLDDNCDGQVNEGCACVENWVCGDWSDCVNDVRTRTCTDQNSCGTEVDKPETTTGCCLENWSCGDWTLCVNGTQTKNCTDANDCGTVADKPETEQDCEEVYDMTTFWILIGATNIGIIVVILVTRYIERKHKRTLL